MLARAWSAIPIDVRWEETEQVVREAVFTNIPVRIQCRYLPQHVKYGSRITIHGVDHPEVSYFSLGRFDKSHTRVSIILVPYLRHGSRPSPNNPGWPAINLHLWKRFTDFDSSGLTTYPARSYNGLPLCRRRYTPPDPMIPGRLPFMPTSYESDDDNYIPEEQLDSNIGSSYGVFKLNPPIIQQANAPPPTISLPPIDQPSIPQYLDRELRKGMLTHPQIAREYYAPRPLNTLPLRNGIYDLRDYHSG
ncbi:hypothetical protein CVT26_005403 [Gymnopilus dilepis]|uniref:Uncharacterized protein n=1 Tax=Gymnopilus dilepis TaxID=231916 RepID=A0A409WZ17_9AGAR|nr:hypothetical protein CVT26_005403 [Gymnopilus dilepis]